MDYIAVGSGAVFDFSRGRSGCSKSLRYRRDHQNPTVSSTVVSRSERGLAHAAAPGSPGVDNAWPLSGCVDRLHRPFRTVNWAG